MPQLSGRVAPKDALSSPYSAFSVREIIQSGIQLFKKFSLPKKRRLHDAKEFTAVFRFQHQASSRYIQIYAKPNGLSYSRLGLIVSKKIERGAVKRNRVKRLLRETFRTFQKNSGTVEMDWIMRLRCPITMDISAKITAEIRTLMHQLQKCHD